MKLNRRRVFLTLLLVLGIGGVFITQAADHMDVPTSGAITRPDANLTDFHPFTRGANLVLSLSTNAAIPTSASDYIFPTDVTFDFNIDNHSVVVGGIIADPSNIRNDITFRVTFRDDGSINFEDFIIEQLDAIEPGLRLVNRQLSTPAGRLDLLCKDTEGNYVVVELKRMQGTDQVVGQILRYMGWLKETHHTEKVRGIIIVGRKDQTLSYAVSGASNVTVKEFKILT